ncbi:hypothetical protein D5086_011248 [Populus alba]|uniref:Uncharacterized protein n=2 Tax=Populus TaxID=3689 RepID=A0ACC4CD88_POPAL|nr:hypothetical protein POTOM_019752 [Populus tomentosa]
MFKKPKLRNYDYGPGSGDSRKGNLYKTICSKRNTIDISRDEDGFNFGRGRNVGAHHQSYGDWETILDDNRKVEDDVRPDFMCSVLIVAKINAQRNRQRLKAAREKGGGENTDMNVITRAAS